MNGLEAHPSYYSKYELVVFKFPQTLMFTKDNACLRCWEISFKARSSVAIISLNVDYLKCRIILILHCENGSQNLSVHVVRIGNMRRFIYYGNSKGL